MQTNCILVNYRCGTIVSSTPPIFIHLKCNTLLLNHDPYPYVPTHFAAGSIASGIRCLRSYTRTESRLSKEISPTINQISKDEKLFFLNISRVISPVQQWQLHLCLDVSDSLPHSAAF